MKTKKTVTAVTATALAAAMLLTGTFAWQNFFQTALNETQDTINPGARLHDDFNGTNKDVYVENFTDPADGQPIYARVRLDEFMEFGATAGTKNGTIGDSTTVSLVPGKDIDDVENWTTHIPGETTFSQYWHWDMGGSTIYMPTFDKNKDSIAADINGTFAGTDATDDIHYDDYVEYADGDTKTANAKYDADGNAVDEGDAAVLNTNYTETEETHTAKETLDATVLTMAEWLAAGGQKGNFWVGDTDGWYYWANPIMPGTATGNLLDGIELIKQPDDSWYYAINVVGQFITAGDAGRNDSTGFFQDGDPTDNAITLLNTIGVNTDYVGDVTVLAANTAKTAALGESLQMSAVAKLAGSTEPAPDQTMTWTVDGATDPDTTVDSTGKLTIGANEVPGTVLTVTATSDKYGLQGTYDVQVINGVMTAIYERPAGVQSQNTVDDTVTLDGVEYYVLYNDKDNHKALLLAKKQQADINMNGYSNSKNSKASRWDIATSRQWLNKSSGWLNGKTELQKYIIPVTISTQDRTKNNSYYNTTDKVFLLSAADIAGKKDNGRYTVQDELDPRAYTVVDGNGNGVILGSAIPDNLTGDLTWLRSPAYVEKNEKNKWGYMLLKTDGSFFEMDGHKGINCYVRPAVWVDTTSGDIASIAP